MMSDIKEHEILGSDTDEIKGLGTMNTYIHKASCRII